MRSFLRQIRGHFLKGNKVTSYLLYALGEIVLVVLGILIAIQINDWNEERKTRRFEREMLGEIAQNLQRDERLLRQNISNIQAGIEAINILTSGQDLSTDSIGKLLGRVICFERFVPNTSAFEVLRSKGLTIITNKKLREAITQYYDTNINQVIEGMADIEYEFEHEWYPVLRTEFQEFSFKRFALPKDPIGFIQNSDKLVFLHLARDNRAGSVEQVSTTLANLNSILEEIEAQ